MRQAVSQTASLVALYRAIESSRPRPRRLFEDPFAATFLEWRLRWALRLSRLPWVGGAMPWALVTGQGQGPRVTVAVRTRYIDDALEQALIHGAEQLVILGAGFDSRAYRIRRIEQTRTRVFELDHPVTQARKRELIRRRLGVVPPNVTFIPIDFMTQTLDAAVSGSGYRREATTFFICEGVTHYLSASAVDALLRSVARGAGPGSRMVFTYIHRGILDGSATFAGAAETIASVRRAGEPYTFGFDPGELPRYLRTRRLGLIEDIGAATYRERYLVPAGRGHEVPAEFQRAALVETLGDARGE